MSGVNINLLNAYKGKRKKDSENGNGNHYDDPYTYHPEDFIRTFREDFGIPSSAISDEEIKGIYDTYNIQADFDGNKVLVPNKAAKNGYDYSVGDSPTKSKFKAVDAARNLVLETISDLESRYALAVEMLVSEATGLPMTKIQGPMYKWNVRYAGDKNGSLRNVMDGSGYVATKSLANGGKRPHEKHLGVKNPYTYVTATELTTGTGSGIDNFTGEINLDEKRVVGHNIPSEDGGLTELPNVRMQGDGNNGASGARMGTEGANSLVFTSHWPEKLQWLMEQPDTIPELTLDDKRRNRALARWKAHIRKVGIPASLERLDVYQNRQLPDSRRIPTLQNLRSQSAADPSSYSYGSELTKNLPLEDPIEKFTGTELWTMGEKYDSPEPQWVNDIQHVRSGGMWVHPNGVRSFI